MLFGDLVDISTAVSATSSRLEKIDLLAGFLSRLGPAEALPALAFLAGGPRQSPLGVGYATVSSLDAEPVPSATLTIVDIDAAIAAVAAASGPGSVKAKRELLEEIHGKATRREQEFLRGLLLRNIRQGALEGIMAEAVAAATGVPVAQVRRAAMLRGDLIEVAAEALVSGWSALASPELDVMTPVQPMLAKTAASAGEAVTALGAALVEQKLDGLRIQVHRSGDLVLVFTRNLRDVTSGMPRVVEAVRSLPVDTVILDGEALLLDAAGSPMSFQDSMSGMAETSEIELEGFYFDILHLDGADLIDSPLRNRRDALARAVPDSARVGSVVTDDPAAADAFFESSVDDGFEGVVVKDLDQPYEAGRRGSGWLKVKPTHTLDLVILAAEWGSGRREGWLSNLHLGARHPDGGFVMLGKTFKGLTDEMLAWQTKAFLEIERSRSGHVVFLEPEIVYEIAFDGVQRSTRYPGGVALRFARVKRHRDDKAAGEADTIDTVRSYM